jgi:hypothetical protein
MLLPFIVALAVQSNVQLDYLRHARLVASTDTFDTFTSEPNGALQRGAGASVVRVMAPGHGGRWELVDTWFDSTGKATARQSTRTAPHQLATELAAVRADVDSAALLVSSDHATAWVVPAGQGPRLFDGDATGERYDLTFVAAAIARRRPAVGSVFRFPGYTLYGGSPLEARIDSVRVIGRDTLTRGTGWVRVVVLQRPSGGLMWVDEATGAEVASRGNAGPGRWWWHVRRGVTAPR